MVCPMTSDQTPVSPDEAEASTALQIAPSDGWDQLMKVLEKVPFVAGVKRDVGALRRLVIGRRPPRIAIIGNSGSGRSRLVNGLIGAPVLRESEKTHRGSWVFVNAEGRRMEWMELEPVVPATRWPQGQAPDVIVLVATADEVASGLGTHLEALTSAAGTASDGEPKFVAVLTKSDTIDEAGPSVEMVRQRYARQILDAGLGKVHVHAISVPAPQEQRSGVPSAGTEALAENIAEQVPDEAAVETARAFVAPKAQGRVADSVIQSTSTLALTVALAPVPLSDIAIIAPLQGLMVSTIAHLGGRSLQGGGASEWAASIGVAGGVGIGFRTLARQVVKSSARSGQPRCRGHRGCRNVGDGTQRKTLLPEPSIFERSVLEHTALDARPRTLVEPRASALYRQGVTFEPPQFPQRFNLASYFLDERVNEGRGDRRALVVGDESFTYAEVQRRANRACDALREAGVRPEERVLMLLFDGVPFVETWFGILKAGAVFCMANPLGTADDLRYLLEYTRCTAVVADTSLTSKLDAVMPDSCRARFSVGGEKTEGWIDWEAALASASDEVTNSDTSRDDVAGWLFTSGTTGKPKGAVHFHRHFAYSTECYAKNVLGLHEDDVFVSVSRLFFGYGTGTNLMFPFAVGGTAVLFPEKPTADRLIDHIEAHKVSVLTNVPAMIRQMVDSERAADLSSVRICLSAGEALPAELYKRWKDRFPSAEVLDGIGSAEMFHIYITNRMGDVKLGSLGQISKGMKSKSWTATATP